MISPSMLTYKPIGLSRGKSRAFCQVLLLLRACVAMAFPTSHRVADHCRPLPAEISSDFEAMAASISQYLEVVEYNEYGSTIFARGDRSGEVYLVQTGIVSCEVRTLLGVPMHSHHVFIASYRFG